MLAPAGQVKVEPPVLPPGRLNMLSIAQPVVRGTAWKPVGSKGSGRYEPFFDVGTRKLRPLRAKKDPCP